MRNTFILYTSYHDILTKISPEDGGYILRAILTYVKDGVVIELPQHLKMAFWFIKNQLDVDFKKYDEKVEKLKANGRKGGLARRSEAKAPDDEIFTVNEPLKPCENNVANTPSSNMVTDEEREILKKFVEKNKLATKNADAYVSKIIQNGDHKRIIEECKNKGEQKTMRTEKIKNELASIHDKRSAARVLAPYYMKSDPPEEFNEVMIKYDLDTYDKIEKYYREVSRLIEEKKLPPPAPRK